MASELHPLLSCLLPDSGPLVKAKCCSWLSAQGPQSQAIQTAKARTNPAQLGLPLAGPEDFSEEEMEREWLGSSLRVG